MSPAARGEATPRRVAMDCLARREHSAAELRRKLGDRDYSAEAITATLVALEQEGLQSDRRFAEAFARSRCRRGKGPSRVRAELRERGVAEELVDLALQDLDWAAAARAARQKKFGPDIPADFADRAKQMRFLQYRGFGSDEIRHALAGDWDQD